MLTCSHRPRKRLYTSGILSKIVIFHFIPLFSRAEISNCQVTETCGSNASYELYGCGNCQVARRASCAIEKIIYRKNCAIWMKNTKAPPWATLSCIFMLIAHQIDKEQVTPPLNSNLYLLNERSEHQASDIAKLW